MQCGNTACCVSRSKENQLRIRSSRDVDITSPKFTSPSCFEGLMIVRCSLQGVWPGGPLPDYRNSFARFGSRHGYRASMTWFHSTRQRQLRWRLLASEVVGGIQREQNQDHRSSIVGTVRHLFCSAGPPSWKQKSRRPGDCTERNRVLHGSNVR